MYFSLSLITSTVGGDGEIVELAAEGKTMAMGVSADEDSIERLLGAGCYARNVMIDMKDVPYIDSATIGWLIRSQKMFRAQGGQLILHSVQPAVRNVLELLKISRLIVIAADGESARAGTGAVAVNAV